jgi:tRNA(Ile)-lysidine synthase
VRITSVLDNKEVTPVSAAEFSALMARLGPFENNPKIAVAVSGGADSMALLHLAAAWASGQRGSALAFTVDHALRPEAADEARQVAAWAKALGVEHHTLVWDNPEPTRAALQERARRARYHLLGNAAQSHGILHILVAHHQDDQIETLLMRINHDSGEDGLAGMAAIVELPEARVIRPLLPIPKARLIATCRACGQAWIEDLSNRNGKFERVRVRENRDDEQARLLLSAVPERARQRAEREAETARFLARHAEVSAAGAVSIAFDAWQAADGEIRRRSLMQTVRMVGGEAYNPRLAQQSDLLEKLGNKDFKQATLGGCLIKKSAGALTIAQENRAGAVKKPCLPNYPLGPARFPVV